MTKYGFKQLSVDNWREPDPMLEIFVRLAPDGAFRRPTGDERAQELLAPTLREQVPVAVRRLFEVARGALLYGYFFYPLYTLGVEQLFRVAEAAVTHKCRQIGAPAKVNKAGFEEKLQHLVDEGVILMSGQIVWDATRRLRNFTSHPANQMILGPPDAVRELWQIAGEINALFDDYASP